MKTNLFRTVVSLMVIMTASVFLSPQASAQDKPSKDGKVHKGYSATAPQYEVNGRVISNVDLRAYLWNPRGKSKEQIRERAAYLLEAYDLKRTPKQQERAKQAREKYKDAIVINSVIIGAIGTAGTEYKHLIQGLKRNRDAGVTLASFTAYAYPSDGKSLVLDRLELSRIAVKELGMVLVNNTDDIRRAKKEGKLAVMFNTQGADYAVDDLGMMKKVKEMGVHVSNFTYNNNSPLAGGGATQDKGVTELGRKWIAECNRLGIVVDVSHSSNQTAIEAAKLSKKPIIASHSNADSLYKLNRNLSDEAMHAIGKTGGVVATTGVGLFLNSKGVASPEEFAKHVEYTAKQIGRDKTGFSTDYMHAAKEMFLRDVANVKVFPPENGFGSPATNMACEHAWDVVGVLEDKYGWSETDIRGFLGENLLRVYTANWK